MIRDIFDQAKRHPYTVAVVLFVCLVASGTLGALYVRVSNERLDARQERLTLMDERLKAQEEATKRQKQLNKYVQEQLATLKSGFNELPRAIANTKSLLDDSMRSNAIRKPLYTKLSQSIATVEKRTIALKAAIDNSEALQKALDPFLTGAIAEELLDYKRAAELYSVASNSGLAQADYRLARLYLSGRGVEMNPERAIQLYELAALKGAAEAKTEIADLYLTGNGVPKDPIMAAAFLSLRPSSPEASAKAQAIGSRLDPDDKVQLGQTIRLLEKRQASITHLHFGISH